MKIWLVLKLLWCRQIKLHWRPKPWWALPQNECKQTLKTMRSAGIKLNGFWPHRTRRKWEMWSLKQLYDTTIKEEEVVVIVEFITDNLMLNKSKILSAQCRSWGPSFAHVCDMWVLTNRHEPWSTWRESSVVYWTSAFWPQLWSASGYKQDNSFTDFCRIYSKAWTSLNVYLHRLKDRFAAGV